MVANGARPLTGKHPFAYRPEVGTGDPDALYRALADPTRRAILDELAERDGQTLFEICARLATRHGLTATRQANSWHLAVLEEAGLVSTRREGRYKLHHFVREPLRAIVARWPLADPEEDR
jgi:DNA-binding transcriptional ArsR family regulator